MSHMWATEDVSSVGVQHPDHIVLSAAYVVTPRRVSHLCIFSTTVFQRPQYCLSGLYVPHSYGTISGAGYDASAIG
ncbi:hypothetical protein AG1IA_09689 [Rhizoctonia solani AG-1 IA]|uniref:Uncharacterized protein n=1 Tax=Thanatephorus cucumeris (strain AG1-IA) TaxID=983506 RepID=L8WDP6_THACA|nr:hypothetical protein AG1IA_09689 [Rhizoctonia solani AG-1 IA]